MVLSELRIENFRMFDEGEHAFVLPLRPGLTALVGENDAGKTAVIDALRFALGTPIKNGSDWKIRTSINATPKRKSALSVGSNTLAQTI